MAMILCIVHVDRRGPTTILLIVFLQTTYNETMTLCIVDVDRCGPTTILLILLLQTPYKKPTSLGSWASFSVVLEVTPNNPGIRFQKAVLEA